MKEQNTKEISAQLDRVMETKGIVKTDRLAILLVFRDYLKQEQAGNETEAKRLRLRCKLMICKAMPRCPAP